MGHYVEWRAFVGPPWKPDTATAHWDWSSLDAGDAYDPETAIPPTTLTATLSSGATTATVASTTGWPSAGSAWIGPNAAGQSWERVDYTGKSGTTLTGLTRETADNEQAGAHSSGASVRFWWALDTADGVLSITEEMVESKEGTLATVTWTARLQGVTIPQAALRTGNLLLVQTRWESGGAMGDWENLLVGWLDSPEARDDHEKRREWSVQVLSIGGRLAGTDAPGIRVGGLNAARDASASASDTLGAARKEADSGEYSGEPSFAAGNVSDGSSGTLWFGERYVGKANVPAAPGTAWDGIGDTHISQLHIRPYVGQSNGYRWVEITRLSNGTFGGTSAHWLAADDHYFVNMESASIAMEAGQHLILAENPTLFAEENPSTDAVAVVDLREYQLWADATGSAYYTGDPGTDIFDHIDIAGGALRIAGSEVVWGTGARHESSWQTNAGSSFASASIAAPGPGETMRYDYTATGTTQSADYWEVSNVATPGYTVESSSRGWVLLELERMDLSLAGDINNSQTTGIVLMDSAGDPSCDGLPASGTIQIGNEQISYTALTRSTGTLAGTVTRGASSTTAASHSEGDKIYFVDSGVATDALPVESIVISRPAGSMAIRDFNVWASKLTTARTPGDSYWTDDYSVLATVTGNTTEEYTVTPGSPARIRHLLVEITKMGTQPARPRINEIACTVDADVYGDTTMTGVEVGAAIGALLDEMGIPSGAYTDGGDTLGVDNYTTASDSALAVLADLAEYTGTRVVIGRDSKLSTSRDDYWPVSGVPSATQTYTRSHLAGFEPVFRNGQQVGQVELEWRNEDESESGLERYPASRDPAGRVLRIGPHIHADSTAAAAAAQKRYWMARRPYTLLAEFADEQSERRAGEYHRIQWQIDEEMEEMDRTYLAVVVEHEIRLNRWRTVGNWAQISREDER